MVRSSTLLVAAVFVIAPVLSAPTPHHHHRKHIAADSLPVVPESSAVTERSIDDADIEVREPNPFSFRKAFSSVANVVKKVAPIALKYAPMIMGRDEEGNLYVRELDEDELAFLSARDSKLTLGPSSKYGGRQYRGPVIPTNQVKPMSSTQSLGLRELDDGVHLEEREFDPSTSYLDLEERDFDFDEFDARDPWTFRGVWNDVKNVAGKVLKVIDKVSSTAHRIGMREFDDEVVGAEARSLNELD